MTFLGRVELPSASEMSRMARPYIACDASSSHFPPAQVGSSSSGTASSTSGMTPSQLQHQQPQQQQQQQPQSQQVHADTPSLLSDAARLGDADPGRADFTKVRATRRGDKQAALLAISTPEGRAEALAEFDRDVFAPSGEGVNSGYETTWRDFHRRWFMDVPAIPLTVDSIRCVAATLKKGRYRSFYNYANVVKQLHITAGYEYTQSLELIMSRAARSVNRGIGPSKQALTLSIVAVARIPRDVVMYLNLKLVNS